MLDLSTQSGRRVQGRRIQTAAEKVGLSLEELAREIGCSRALLYHYVSGNTLAQPDRLQQIAVRTGVPLAVFYSDEDTDPAGLVTVDGIEEKKAWEQERAQLQRRIAELSALNESGSTDQLRQRLDSLMEALDLITNPMGAARLVPICHQILPLARELGDEHAEAETLLKLGNYFAQRGDLAEAESTLRPAGDTFNRLEETSRQCVAKQTLGQVYLREGHTEMARQLFGQVIGGGSWHNRWQGTLSLGAVSEYTGDYIQAMNHFDEALQIAREAPEGYDRSEAMVYIQMNIANVYMATGDFKSALNVVNETSREAYQIGLNDQLIEAEANQATAEYHLGNWDKSVYHSRRALDICHFAGDRVRDSSMRAWLLPILSLTEGVDKAKQEGVEALKSALQTNNKMGQLFAYWQLGRLQGTLEDARECLYYLDYARTLASELKAIPLLTAVQIARASLLVKVKRHAEAVAEGKAGLTSAENIGARHLEAEALCVLSEIPSANGRSEDALRLAQELEMPELEAMAHTAIGKAVLVRDLEQALEHFQRAVIIIENLRSKLAQAGLMDASLEEEPRHSYYRQLITTLLDSGRVDEAEAIALKSNWSPLLNMISPPKD